MRQREVELRNIAVGDIFHARAARNIASFICVALQVRENTIFARRITTQSVHEFDRTTGVEDPTNPIVITSVAPLPEDIRAILLNLDRKYRESEDRFAEDPTWQPTEDETRLTKDQIRALVFVGQHYDDNPI